MGQPSGLGHFEVSLYLRIGHDLQQGFSARSRGPACVLDLGTYFGHSAFTILQGAAQASAHPDIRILSLDIFEQPEWLLTQPDIALFVRTYGSTLKDAVEKSLRDRCIREGLPTDSITLWKKNVNQLTAEELSGFALDGFDAVAVDCGKTPELMNRITTLICDSRVTRVGTLVCFQDFFDWHAPWNLFAFWKLLDLGFIRIRSIEPEIAPVAEIAKHGDPGLVCDRIEHREPDWSTIYTDAESELAAFDAVIRLLDRLHQPGLALRVQCLRVGALLRHGQLSEAEALIHSLDAQWPPWLRDGPLQNAYRRYAHLKTGTKDLTRVLATPSTRRRSSGGARLLQKAYIYYKYLGSSGTTREIQLLSNRRAEEAG